MKYINKVLKDLMNPELHAHVVFTSLQFALRCKALALKKRAERFNTAEEPEK